MSALPNPTVVYTNSADGSAHPSKMHVPMVSCLVSFNTSTAATSAGTAGWCYSHCSSSYYYLHMNEGSTMRTMVFANQVTTNNTPKAVKQHT
jgi:hypothetical protein